MAAEKNAKSEDELILVDDIKNDIKDKGDEKPSKEEAKGKGKKDEIRAHVHEVSPDEGIEELKAKLVEREASEARERARAEAAERATQESNREVARVKGSLFEKEFQVADSAIDSAKREAASAKAMAATAYEAGDYKNGLEHQERLALAAAQLVQLENYRARLEVRKEQAEEQAAQEAEQRKQAATQRQPTADENFDAFVNTRTPKSASWLRDHRKEAMDPVTWNLILAADQEARRDGCAVDSSDYFEHIENRLEEWKGEERVKLDTPEARERGTKKPSYNAPPTRASGSNRASNPNEVRLSKDEKEMALTLRPDLSREDALRNYARNKLAIQRDKESLH